MANYTGPSIVDYLSSIGQPSDYATRASLAASKGIKGYTGSADQNTALLGILRGSTQQPVNPTQLQSQPQPQFTTSSPTSVPQAGSASNPLVEALVTKGGYNQQDAINAASGPRSADLAREFLGVGQPSTSGSIDSFITPTTIDLNGIYKNLYDSSGISKLESDLAAKTDAYNKEVSTIGNNPYLSEATMSGRIAKLASALNNDTKSIQDQIAMRKADIQTNLNLQTKQFDINSQQAQTAISHFNSLLSSGALSNLSGEDIAKLTAATGIPSSIITSAIAASNNKNVKTQLITSTDDSGNVTVSTINSNTGELINKTSLGQVGTAKKSGGLSASDQKAADVQQTESNLIGDIQRGAILKDLVGHYGVNGGVDVQRIYQLYNSYSPYGSAQETLDDVKQGKFVA